MSRDVQELERWVREHPVHAHFTTVGLALLVLELAVLLNKGLEWLASCVR